MNDRMYYFVVNKQQRGFTFVELIIIIALIGILGATFFYSDDNTQDVTLRAQAEQLASDIRYAQTLGITKGARYRINFLNACQGAGTPDCYWFSNQDNTTRINSPRTNTDQITLSNGIVISATDSAFIFNGKGIPFNSANTALTSNAVITLSSSGETPRAIIVSPETGRVVIQ